jgi:hypothetical protein
MVEAKMLVDAQENEHRMMKPTGRIESGMIRP